MAEQRLALPAKDSLMSRIDDILAQLNSPRKLALRRLRAIGTCPNKCMACVTRARKVAAYIDTLHAMVASLQRERLEALELAGYPEDCHVVTIATALAKHRQSQARAKDPAP